MESDQPLDLSEAFPESFRTDVRTVLEALPKATDQLHRSPDDIAFITLTGERLRIPMRIYAPEPDWSWVESLPPIEQSIVGSLYTRHHDGHVRERAFAHISALNEAWVAPFVIQLLGEYVIELVERAALQLEGQPKPGYAQFVRENPNFLRLTIDRATSYWNEYYRQRFRKREDYPAFRAIDRLTKWSLSDTAA